MFFSRRGEVGGVPLQDPAGDDRSAGGASSPITSCPSGVGHLDPLSGFRGTACTKRIAGIGRNVLVRLHGVHSELLHGRPDLADVVRLGHRFTEMNRHPVRPVF